MVSKKLVVSVDNAVETASNTNDIDVIYPEDVLDVFAPVDDLQFFDTKTFHADKQKSKEAQSEKPDVNFEVTLDPNKFDLPHIKRYPNPFLIAENSTSNIVGTDDEDYLNSEESQEKRLARAKRFGVGSKSDDSTTCLQIPDVKQLQQLYNQCELDVNEPKIRDKYRFNAILIRGVAKWDTNEVFKHFKKFEPRFLEWVDDSTCNLVWNEKDLAARALLGASKLAKFIDSRAKTDVNTISPLKRKPKLTDLDGDEVMLSDGEEEEAEEASTEKDLQDDSIKIDKRQFVVPPGFKWRVCFVNKNETDFDASNILFLRFATIDDVKSSKSERNSQYYRRNGNPNYGDLRGLVSGSRREKINANRQSFAADNFGQSGYSDLDRPLGRYKREADDLRQRLQDKSRWHEIRSSARRASDDEAQAAEFSPYSDEEERVAINCDANSDDEGNDIIDRPPIRQQRPLRMRMRADDVQDKSKNIASSWGFGTKRTRRKRAESFDSEEEIPIMTVPTVVRRRKGRGHRQKTPEDNDKKDEVEEIEEKGRSRSRSPLDLKHRLQKYRMKITVDNRPAKTSQKNRHSDSSDDS